MSIKILGTGSFLPPNILTNNDFEKFLDTTDEWITTRTGIKTRHIVKDEQNVDMASAAANRALEAAGLVAQDITAIVCATVTSEMCVPSLASQVQRELGIESCCAFDVSAACTGFMYALHTAAGLCALADETVLVIGCETLSRLTDYEDRASCVLFGDGAGAAIVRKGDNLKYIKLYSIPDKDHALEIKGLNYNKKENKPEFSYIRMIGKEIYKFATREIERVVTQAFETLSITSADIDMFLPHQANARIIDAAAKRLKIPIEKFFVNIHEVGNMSSACIPIGLDEMFKKELIKKGDTIMLMGFGGGLTSACAVYEV